MKPLALSFSWIAQRKYSNCEEKKKYKWRFLEAVGSSEMPVNG